MGFRGLRGLGFRDFMEDIMEIAIWGLGLRV